MQHITEMIDGTGGVRLYIQRYELEEAIAGVVILHGYCEHSQRYGHVVERFLEAGISCYLLDHRGHGKSDGPRAAVKKFEEYNEDLDKFMTLVRSWGGDKPLFLLGHSMGGLIATDYMLTRKPDIAGVLLSSPFLGLKVSVPLWKESLGKLFSHIMPSLSMKSDLDPYLLTHDEAIVQEYIADPAVPKIANARWFTEATSRQEYLFAHAGEWKWPALLMHGGDDRIADPEATKKLNEKIPDSLSQLAIFDGLYHEIFNEIDRKMVLDKAVLWMRSRIEGK